MKTLLLLLALVITNCINCPPKDDTYVIKQSFDIEYMFQKGDEFEITLKDYDNLNSFWITVLVYDWDMHVIKERPTRLYDQDGQYLYFRELDYARAYTEYHKPVVIIVHQEYKY